MNNSQIAQKEILLFSQFHLLSCLYPLFLSRLKLDLDDPVIETVETIKMGLLVLGSFNLYFKSLGLDITSVLLNTFKMAATYPLHLNWKYLKFDLFLSKNPMDSWFPHNTLWIEKVWSITTSFQFKNKNLLKLDWILFFSILLFYIEDTFTKLSQLIDWH